MAFVTGVADPPGFGLKHFQADDWALLNGLTGPRFLVADSGALRPTANTGAIRTVTVAAGVAAACGVPATNAAAENIAFAANAGAADRWDVLVAVWNWSAGTVVFAVKTGGAEPPSVNGTTTPDDALINRIPGVRYDGAVAAVRVRPGVSTFTADDVVDLRVWGGGGGLRTNAATRWDLIDLPAGGQLEVPAPTVLDPAATKIIARSGGGWRQISPALIGFFDAPWTNPAGQWGGSSEMTRFTVPDPGVPYRPQVYLSGEFGSMAVGTRYDFIAGYGGTAGTATEPAVRLWRAINLGQYAESIRSWAHMGDIGPAVLTGAREYRLVSARVFGTANGFVSGVNRLFRVHYWAA